MNKKNIIKIILLCVFVFTLYSSFTAHAIDLPAVEGVESPIEDPNISNTAKWAFYFLVSVSSVAAFGVLVWSGFMYMTSAGNPTQIQDAKSRAGAAIFGIVFILASYLILTTLNPELTTFTTKTLDIQDGILLKNTTTGKQWNYIQSTGIISSKIRFDNDGNIKENSSYEIEFIAPPEKLSGIYVYGNESFKNGIGDTFYENNGGTISLGSATPGSIYLLWNKAGVYLYDDDNPERPPKYLSSSSRTLGSFVNATDRIIINEKDGKNFNVIMFSDSDYFGKYALLDKTEKEGMSLDATSIKINNLSSIFVYHPSATPKEITLFSQINKGEPSCSTSEEAGIIKEVCAPPKEFEMHSMSINPDTAVLLDLSNEKPIIEDGKLLNPPGIGELFVAHDSMYTIDDIKTTKIYTIYDACNLNNLIWLSLVPGINGVAIAQCLLQTVLPQIALPKSFIIIPFAP